MKLRALLPWLVFGGLLASSYTNIVLLGVRDSATPPTHTPHRDSNQSIHRTRGSVADKCPTLEILGLDREQRDQIRKSSLSSLDVRIDLAIEIEESTAILDGLLSQGEVSATRVLDLADRISDLRSKQYRTWINSILAIREALTPEQLRTLHELEFN